MESEIKMQTRHVEKVYSVKTKGTEVLELPMYLRSLSSGASTV